jgi:nitrogen regulatory protein PII
MKKIIAVIRPNKYFETRDALAQAGFPSMSAVACLGRGKGKRNMFTTANGEKIEMDDEQMVSKKLFIMVVRDEDASAVIKVISKANHTGTPGDGKIFTIAVSEIARIRTGERSDNAIM